MKIREHRGSLDESMKTTKEIPSTHEALVDHVTKCLEGWPIPKPIEVDVIPYGMDQRNGWLTHIVIIKGWGPFGFTDGPLETSHFDPVTEH